MAHNPPVHFFLFSSFFFFLRFNLASDTSNTCSVQFCKAYEPAVRFPFRLKQFQPNERCVYPGFDLSCNSQGKTTFNISTSEEFVVDSIYYREQILWLTDPNKCLFKRLRNFTSLDSNWMVQYYKSFTLFKCPRNESSADLLRYQVTCLNETDYITVAFSTDNLSDMKRMAASRCMDNWTVAIPSLQDYDIDYSGLPRIFGLMWTNPSCGVCTRNFEQCGFKGHSGLEIECFKPQFDGMHNSSNFVKKSVIIPSSSSSSSSSSFS